jgi:hypothetical protein
VSCSLPDKDPIILGTLSRLWSRLGPGSFEVVNHWEADRTAVGIASPRSHRVLVNISSHEDGFHVELELPSAAGDDLPYRVAGRASGLDFEQLVGVVAEHLARA